MAAFGLSLPNMLERLSAVAAAGELPERFGISSISRHARGLLFPSPILQDLYSRATDRAVQPQDWVELHMELRADPSPPDFSEVEEEPETASEEGVVA